MMVNLSYGWLKALVVDMVPKPASVDPDQTLLANRYTISLGIFSTC
jgi:hypothetical protein